MALPALPQWRVLADDLTGALDSAAAFAGAGPVPVALVHDDAPAPASAAPLSAAAARAQRVQARCTGTRDVPAASLPARLAPHLAWLQPAHDDQGAHPAQAFKKIDSLLRGNTFAEIAWLAHHGRFDRVVLAPAFPDQGRFTCAGRHWVAAPHEPTAPRSYEHPQPLLQSLAEAGLDAQADPTHIWIPDITCDADLDQLAALSRQPGAERWLWCGSAGLAWALARAAGLAPTNAAGASPATPAAPMKAPALVASASRHAVLRTQWQRLVRRNDAGPPRTAAWHLRDLAEPHPLSPADAAARLQREAQRLVRDEPRPGALVVVGGDTLLALCEASGAHGLAAGPGPRAGWGAARLEGGRWDGVPCFSRSGAFGADDDLCDLLDSLPLKESTT